MRSFELTGNERPFCGSEFPLIQAVGQKVGRGRLKLVFSVSPGAQNLCQLNNKLWYIHWLIEIGELTNI